MLALAAILLLALIGVGLHVATSLGLLGAILAEIYTPFPLLRGVGEISWGASADFILVAVPMFILMGELLLRSGVTDRMYGALDKWVGGIPGGLMHTNIAACAIFAATSGSSVATAATVGTVSIPNMTRLGYNPALYLGSIAAGGTLGILIPPSINMILYAALAEQSVGDLYLAALIPGFLLALLFSLAIWTICRLRPDLDGDRSARDVTGRMLALLHLLPPIGLFALVVGSIYLGWATATEAAALGVVASVVLAYFGGNLNAAILMRAFEGTMRTTSMVMLIIIAAFFLNFVMATIGLTDAAVAAVKALAWPPLAVLLAIIAVYLVLGCFVDTLSLMIATTPVVVPIITNLGYSPLWFGVVFVILIEAALITPPIGMNLFVVQSVRGPGPFEDIARGSIPFLIMMLLLLAALIALPDLALWLPETLRS